MKQARYAYAEYCFKLCRNIINQNSMQYLQYLSGVEYNLALCYFFTQNYQKSIEILKKLKDTESMKNNPYLFYRLALCYIEQEFQKNKKAFKENNENDLVCKTIYDETCDEPAFKKRFLLVNQSLAPGLNGTKEETEENNNDLISVQKLDFNEAIRALKECILIIKGYNSFNEQILNTLKPLVNTEVINLKPLFNNNNEVEEIEKENNNIKSNINSQYKEIYDLAYLNLIFCLIRNEHYTEAIESKDNFSYENPDEKGTFFSNSNHQVYDEITYRLALYINLIKINILSNNFKEAEKYVVSLLNLLNYPTEKELPPYVINIIVFYFLSIGKNEEAVQIIKFRRIPKFYNN